MNIKSLTCTLFPLMILGMSSLACQAVTDWIFEEPDPYIPEESVPLEPSIEDEQQLDTPSGHLPVTEPLVCPAVTDKILAAAKEFYEEMMKTTRSPNNSTWSLMLSQEIESVILIMRMFPLS